MQTENTLNQYERASAANIILRQKILRIFNAMQWPTRIKIIYINIKRL